MEQNNDFERAAELYESFTEEICGNGALPDETRINRCASKDARFYLELQKRKTEHLGISSKEELRPAGANEGKIFGWNFDSPKYRGQRLCRGFIRRTDYFRNGRRIFRHKEKMHLYQTIIFAKEGIDPRETYICPSCGGISTLAELERGCGYCGARFLMTELFPKVMDYVWSHDYSFSPKEYGARFFKWEAASCVICSFIAASVNVNVEGSLPLIARVIVGIFLGAIAGFFLSSLALLAKLLFDTFKTLPILSRVMGDKKRFVEFIRPFDPYFVYEQFESRIAALMKIILYSDSAGESAVWCGSVPPAPSDVIDATYIGAIDIQRGEVRGDYIEADLAVYADCTRYKNGSIKLKRECYLMKVVKSRYAVTDPSFSIQKIECATCGASFDGTRTKKCPYCGNYFHLENHDWAVYDFRKE